jgi:hypothetical protein
MRFSAALEQVSDEWAAEAVSKSSPNSARVTFRVRTRLQKG